MLKLFNISDLPGHTIQLPQILQKSGIENISYSRFHPSRFLLHWVGSSRRLKSIWLVTIFMDMAWGFILLDEKNGKRKISHGR
jgi:hypothetical protein